MLKNDLSGPGVHGSGPKPISRSAFFRLAGGAAVGLTAGGLLAACGSDDSGGSTTASGGGATAPAETKGTVEFFGWQGYDDKKAAQPLLSRGVKISPEYITTNDDIVTKLRSGGASSIDIVTPFVGYLPALVAGGLLEEIDYERVPSTKEFFPELRSVIDDFGGGKPYAVSAVWGDTPMVIRPDLMPDPPESWLDLRDPKYKGKLITLDDIYGNILIISRALNGPAKANEMTQAQLDDVVKVWKEIKPNLVTFAPSFGDAADIMARGDAAAMIQGWRFVEQQLKDKNVDAASHMPKEGTYAWADTYAIPKGAPNPEAAYAFIETMVSTRGNALMGAATGSGVSNEQSVAKLPPSQQDLYPYSTIGTFLADDASFYALPLEPDGDYVSYDEWTKAWEEIKAA
jgi:spermidine/putrescine-binding protein